jgi:hypothetical protein
MASRCWKVMMMSRAAPPQSPVNDAKHLSTQFSRPGRLQPFIRLTARPRRPQESSHRNAHAALPDRHGSCEAPWTDGQSVPRQPNPRDDRDPVPPHAVDARDTSPHRPSSSLSLRFPTSSNATVWFIDDPPPPSTRSSPRTPTCPRASRTVRQPNVIDAETDTLAVRGYLVMQRAGKPRTQIGQSFSLVQSSPVQPSPTNDAIHEPPQPKNISVRVPRPRLAIKLVVPNPSPPPHVPHPPCATLRGRMRAETKKKRGHAFAEVPGRRIRLARWARMGGTPPGIISRARVGGDGDPRRVSGVVGPLFGVHETGALLSDVVRAGSVAWVLSRGGFGGAGCA